MQSRGLHPPTPRSLLNLHLFISLMSHSCSSSSSHRFLFFFPLPLVSLLRGTRKQQLHTEWLAQHTQQAGGLDDTLCWVRSTLWSLVILFQKKQKNNNTQTRTDARANTPETDLSTHKHPCRCLLSQVRSCVGFVQVL